jgi:hypothetical protein
VLVVVKILIALVLVLICVQDLKSRAVYWFLFPALAALFVALALQQLPVREVIQAVLLNLGFVAVQLLAVWGWLSFKYKRPVRLTAGWLGWGDVLFLAVLACCFSLVNFIVFYVLGLLLILLGWPGVRRLMPGRAEHIPLAGLQALLLLVVLGYCWYYNGIDLSSDHWLLKFIK